MSVTVIRGSSELSGSWNTICTSRRNQRSSCGRPGSTGRSAERDASGGRPIESEEDAGERRLARTRLADDAERLTGGDVEADAGEGVPFGARPEQAGPRQAVHAVDVVGDEQGLAHDDDLEPLVGRQGGLAGRGEQLDRVRVGRAVDDASGGSRLDDRPAAHHQHVVGDQRNEGDVVGDEQQGGVLLGDEFGEKARARQLAR